MKRICNIVEEVEFSLQPILCLIFVNLAHTLAQLSSISHCQSFLSFELKATGFSLEIFTRGIHSDLRVCTRMQLFSTQSNVRSKEEILFLLSFVLIGS